MDEMVFESNICSLPVAHMRWPVEVSRRILPPGDLRMAILFVSNKYQQLITESQTFEVPETMIPFVYISFVEVSMTFSFHASWSICIKLSDPIC